MVDVKKKNFIVVSRNITSPRVWATMRNVVISAIRIWMSIVIAYINKLVN